MKAVYNTLNYRTKSYLSYSSKFSSFSKLTVKDLDLQGKRVFIRTDFNVPLDGKKIISNQRILAALPTIKYVLANNPRYIILASHLGRPNSERDVGLSLAPVSNELQKLLNKQIIFANDCVGPEVETICRQSPHNSIILLENLRYYIEEEGFKKVNHEKIKASKEDIEKFRCQLSSLADLYINDAFGTVHRPHSSIVGLNFPQRAAGFLLAKELVCFNKVLDNPKKPFLSILGGSKVADKIHLIDNLLDRIDLLIIGGGMAFTFKKILENMQIGDSIFDKHGARIVPGLMNKARSKGVKVILPTDFVIADSLLDSANIKIVSDKEGIPSGWKGVDIGPISRKLFADAMSKAKTIIWNGPPGVFEFSKFAVGTKSLLDEAVKSCKNGNTVIMAGGETSTIALKYGVSDKISHVSTGGGASLEILEGKELPGITFLSENK